MNNNNKINAILYSVVAVFAMQCFLAASSFFGKSENIAVDALSRTEIVEAGLIARIQVNSALISRLEENRNEGVIEVLSNEVRHLILSLNDSGKASIQESIMEKYIHAYELDDIEEQ